MIVCCDCVYVPLYGDSWKALLEAIDALAGPATDVLISLERRHVATATTASTRSWTACARTASRGRRTRRRCPSRCSASGARRGRRRRGALFCLNRFVSRAARCVSWSRRRGVGSMVTPRRRFTGGGPGRASHNSILPSKHGRFGNSPRTVSSAATPPCGYSISQGLRAHKACGEAFAGLPFHAQSGLPTKPSFYKQQTASRGSAPAALILWLLSSTGERH